MRASSLRCLPLIIAAGALPLAAQTTGNLQGRVVDAKGAPVSGARINVTGLNLQGARITTSDTDGAFRVGLLPPGPCTLTVTKEGLNTTRASAVVGLDKTASLEVRMAAVAQATVEVVDQATSVDVKATAGGANFTNESFQKLPVSRDFANIALLAPGVTTESMPGGNQGFKVYGATGAENNYVVDGINTTGVEYGTQGKRIPMEFIQEFQVKTGGYEAEFGRAMGGIINVITKSGGNEYTGDAFLYTEGSFLKSGNQHVNDANQIVRPLQTENKTNEIGFDLGGYLIKDKLWFFVAFDRRTNKQESVLNGIVAPADSTRDLFAGKLTWKLAEGHTLVASFLGDPEKVTGAVKQAQGPASTWDGERKIGGTDFSVRYEATFGTWFGYLQASRHNETNTILPGASGGAIQMVDQVNGGAASGGFGRFDDKAFTRDNLQGAITWFSGPHEFKAGFDFQNDEADIKRGFTGGSLVTRYDNPAYNVTNFADPYVYSHYWWTTADATITPFNAPSITFTSKPKHESQAYYLQGKLAVTPTVLVNVGGRLDITTVKNQFGGSVFKLQDQWSPRLGLVWDFKGKGQDKLYTSFSRYYEQLPLDLVIRSFSVERNPTTYNYSATAVTPNTQAETEYGTASNIVGSYVEPVDVDLKGAYSDEFILGGETTVGNYTLGAKYIRRWLGRAIEDGLDVNSALGDYFIMNPGQSHGAGVTYPQAVRDYKGVEFSIQRKLADHYTWQASYLWSRLDGNYEGAFQGIGGADGTGQLDPNINAAFDLPEFIVNSNGKLSGDRTHQIKANGAYEWDFGLSLGASFQYLSGTPVSRLGYNDYYGRYELFLQQRGTDGRTPDTYRIDANLGYALKLGKGQQVRFNLDITNLLNTQTATVLDQRYDATEGGPQLATYKQAFYYQNPRTIRFGVRYSF